MDLINRGLFPLVALLSGAGIACAEEFTWTPRSSGSVQSLNDILWMGTLLVGVGDSGKVVTSPDGVSWTARTPITNVPLTRIVWTGSKFIVAGFRLNQPHVPIDPYTVTSTTLASENASVWTATTGPGAVLSLAMGSGLIVGGGYSMVYSTGNSREIPMIVKSSDGGATWLASYSGTTTGRVNGVIWMGSRFVAVGSGGSVLTSPDAITWTPEVSGTTTDLYGVVWTGTQLVAVGKSGTVLTSLNGTQWAAQSSGSTLNLRSITWTGTRFVATGQQGVILTSVDGNAWTQEVSGTTQELYAVAWTGTGLVAVGRGGTILTSGAAPVSVAPRRTLNSGGGFAIHQVGSHLNVMVPASMRGPLRAAVYAVGGQKLQEVNALATDGSFSTDASLLAPGIYTLELKSSGKTSRQTFQISR